MGLELNERCSTEAGVAPRGSGSDRDVRTVDGGASSRWFRGHGRGGSGVRGSVLYGLGRTMRWTGVQGGLEESRRIVARVRRR